MSQVFGFAKQSGGDIDVHSILGEGATFTLFLPRVVHDHGRPTRSDMAAGAGTERRLAVLVVEDNIEVETFTTQVLEDIGHTVTLAANAEEALRILELQRDRYDVVFSDVVMPGMSGLDLGLQIRKLYRDLPVILTSGYSHVLAQKGRHGFEVVQKPYGVSDVASAFEKLVRG